jgi:hypothetical protein
MSDMTTLPQRRFCTYWDGTVTWLERLCLSSVMHAGFGLTIFTYEPKALRSQLAGFDIVDIRELIDDQHVAYIYRQQRGGLRVFSDIARLYMLKREIGIWTDADCIFQDHVRIDRPYMFGWISPKRINNAILYLPATSAILDDYLTTLTAVPLRAPWATWRVRVFREIEILSGGKIPRDAGRSSIGPRALTYFVNKYGLRDQAQPQKCYYPLVENEAYKLVDADDRACRAALDETTEIMHAWQGTLKGLGVLEQMPPQGSFAHAEIKRLGLM